jgi:hypothetical protein
VIARSPIPGLLTQVLEQDRLYYIETTTYSGNNIDSEWPRIKANLVAAGFTVNDSNYSSTGTTIIPSEPITLSSFNGVQINQKGTKMKIPADEYHPEAIFTKQ